MNDNTVRFTATLDCKKGHIETSYDSNENLTDICYFVDNVCARLQELKSMTIIKAMDDSYTPEYGKDSTPPPVKINLVPPREQFFIDERKIETLRRPDGTSYIRCIIRLKRDEAIYIVHQLELDTDTDFAYAVKLLIADVDKHASSICEQLHKKAMNTPINNDKWDWYTLSSGVALLQDAATGCTSGRAKIKLKNNHSVELRFTFRTEPFEKLTHEDFLAIIKSYDKEIKQHFKDKNYFLKVGYNYE